MSSGYTFGADAVAEVLAEVEEVIMAVDAGGAGGDGDGSVGLEEVRLGCEDGGLKRRFGASG